MADPFSTKTSTKEHLDNKKTEFEGLTASLHAIGGGLQAKIAEELMKNTSDTIPNFERINRNSPLYNKALAERVKDLVEDSYSLTSSLSPFRKGVDPTKMDSTTAELISNIYFSAKNPIIGAIGTSKFGDRMRSAQARSIEDAQTSILQNVSAGYNAAIHGDPVISALMDMYKFDKKKVDLSALRTEVPTIFQQHLQGVVNENLFYDLAPKYNNKL